MPWRGGYLLSLLPYLPFFAWVNVNPVGCGACRNHYDCDISHILVQTFIVKFFDQEIGMVNL